MNRTLNEILLLGVGFSKSWILFRAGFARWIYSLPNRGVLSNRWVFEHHMAVGPGAGLEAIPRGRDSKSVGSEKLLARSKVLVSYPRKRHPMLSHIDDCVLLLRRLEPCLD